MKSDDKALSFVGQIMTAYKKAAKAESEALPHAIECGKFLNLAKENVKAAKGKWLPWLKENCPEIPQTTASLYMRLAEKQDAIAEAKKKVNQGQTIGLTDLSKTLRSSSYDAIRNRCN